MNLVFNTKQKQPGRVVWVLQMKQQITTLIQSKGWHKEQIKAAVRMRGLTMEQLSVGFNLPKNAGATALNKPYRRAELVIAQFLGVPLNELWPDRWTADGRRIRPRYAHLYFNGKAA